MSTRKSGLGGRMLGTLNGVLPEINETLVGETNVRYRIVTNGGRGRVMLDNIDMLIRHVRARGWHLDGIYENRATRPELQGHPLVRELNGPIWWEEGDCVMYEERELRQRGRRHARRTMLRCACPVVRLSFGVIGASAVGTKMRFTN